MGVHDGHRKRLMHQFLGSGLDGFSPHNVVELLLFFGIPRRDTNPIAHALMETFGSLAGVFDAPYSELIKVPGVGQNAAALIAMVPQLARAYMTDKSHEVCLNSTEKAGQYLMARYVGRSEEAVLMVCIDSKCRVIGASMVHHGSVNATEVNLRKIVSTALQHNAVGVIVAHNHPGGVALPSPEDLVTTERIRAALEPVKIQLVDHIIVADNDFVSLADSGYLQGR